MSSAPEQQSTDPSIKTQQRLKQAMEPHITEWKNSLTKDEIDLIGRLDNSEVTAMFSIWLIDKVTFYSTLWKKEWKRRIVAEANVHELTSDLGKAEKNLKKVKEELRELKFALEVCERREQNSEKENGFLKRVVGSMKWEQANESSVGNIGLGI